MRKVLMLAGLVLVASVLAPAATLAKAGGTDRPIKESSSGTDVVDLGDLSFAIDATGTTSHLGRTTSHFDGSLTPTGPDTVDIAAGVTVIAANGDKLYGTLSGSATTDASGNSGPVVVTFTGGTGRFKGATGHYSGSFGQVVQGSTATSLTFAIEYSLRGTINY